AYCRAVGSANIISPPRLGLSFIRALTPRSNEKHNLKPALRAFSGMYGFRRCGRHQAKHLTTRVWRMWLNKDKQEIQ
ncbi:hypothetical protein, partial [Citrobacter koseri]|uniref:hypothetical protein n=1 Tax=Citrobacter koseri TaxID=545 RepID=UPI00200A16BB